MPEIAEVETVARGLRPLAGRRILAVRFGKTDFIDQPDRIETLLPGSRVIEVRRHGKMLLFRMEPAVPSPNPAMAPIWLIVHLGMTGQLVLHEAARPAAPHTHVWFTLDDGRELRYTDIRRFGHMRIASPEELTTLVAPLGADPLELTVAELRRRLGTRHARVKALLLDQHVLRGLGNIYADESLWRARLHPMRQGSDLSEEEMGRLWRAIRSVVSEAIRLGGTSISDYVDALGRRGGYQKRLRVYRRHGRRCARCSATIERVIVAGRGTHFCPRCQPAPRPARASRHSRAASAKKRLHPAPRLR
ncbi:MAG: bifunctional DNA-formamidopyrimidine glycosylase/DNA-(apurinic or apyrimidinic site) lyase [Acidobacteriota bacterium]|nr:bifunctional DNA-formamidopyrimidine glycosylase/DNA-(apurinic or apyrimidinic site) lyase [Acidobacteriota bacterium]